MAVSSSIRPALRSASIAICLPGIASSVKRAPTSAIRPAPLVITMKLITIRIRNTTRPTAKFPPTRNAPNASITSPAAPGPVWPCMSTTRVEATFSDRRNRVANSNTAGKAAKSSGLVVNMLTSSTITDSAMLKVNSRSSTNGGKGRIIIAMIRMISTGPASILSWLASLRPVRPNNAVMVWFTARSPYPDRPALQYAPARPGARRAPGDSAPAGTPRRALRPPRHTAMPESRSRARRGDKARAPAAAQPAAARRVRRQARESAQPRDRPPWLLPWVRPFLHRDRPAPPRNGSDWSR
ncbi:hypothetical protein T31B1_00695 [Salinisphaera sp. T31B1]